MAKFELKNRAREMRAKGVSVGAIARKLGVAKSTSSLWVRDIILTVEQLEALRQQNIKGSELGRLKGAFNQKKQRLNLIDSYKKEGIKELQKLSKRDLYIAGICLYWAEGYKKSNRFQFINSDPKMILLMMNWVKLFLGVGPNEMTATVGINKIHKSRDKIVKNYWSELTGIPPLQFKKTSFIKTKSKKVYANFDNYYGTLRITLLRSAKFCYKITGLIEGLKYANVAQR